MQTGGLNAESGYLGYEGAPWGTSEAIRARMYERTVLSLELPACRARIIAPYTWTSADDPAVSDSF